MLERLKNAISGGAQPRAVKQSSDSNQPTVPLVNEEMGSVLTAISEHEDSPISIRSLSELTGLTPSKVRGNIRKLVQTGIVVKSESVQGRSTRYWVNRIPTSVEDTETQNQPNESSHYFRDIVETFIWEFVRETRSTDVLLFLTWLDRKVEGDEGV